MKRKGRLFNDRELAAEVRTLTLNECKKYLNKGKGRMYEAILLKLATAALPRINEVTGEDGEPLQVIIPKQVADSFKIKGDGFDRKTIGSDTK